MDETRAYYCTPESKRFSAELTASGESGAKRPKTSKSAGRLCWPIMASVFKGAQGTLFTDYREVEQIIISEWLKKSGGTGKWKKYSFVKAFPRITTWWKRLNELSFELHPHPRYSPDTAISNYYHFSDFKKIFQEIEKFSSTQNVITGSKLHLESKNKSFYIKGIAKVEERWEKCISLKERYFEGKLYFSYSDRRLIERCDNAKQQNLYRRDKVPVV